MATDEPLRYAIIGGGIAGLTLAIALHTRGVSVHVYEGAAKFEEIGAGVSLSPNALQALKICHPGVKDALEKVSIRNIWPSKQKVWFDYYDGQNDQKDGLCNKLRFAITNDLGQRGVHRPHFLDHMAKMIPDGIASFGKSLKTYKRGENGAYTLSFGDGSTATADGIIACDGIKLRVRQVMFGVDHPCAYPTHTHKYAYRALVPIEDAVNTMREEKAQNA